jgi:hypothetical protein
MQASGKVIYDKVLWEIRIYQVVSQKQSKEISGTVWPWSWRPFDTSPSIYYEQGITLQMTWIFTKYVLYKVYLGLQLVL